ncbi:H/ACA ribonucleoprotein complex non-core subunit NAF1 [Culicoides brevitarsis]|uniref:H/ACA ribonucleoprotein complex non-core subunit NAF1 n=1 Tax=Culicoides brevitarsis TaxID=469753 RepID=UPI00307CBD14
MSESTNQDDSLPEKHEETTNPATETASETKNDEFKDNNEVAASADDLPVDSLLQQIVDKSPEAKENASTNAENAQIATKNDDQSTTKAPDSEETQQQSTPSAANNSLSLLAQYDSQDSSSSSDESDTESSGMEVDSADSESSSSSSSVKSLEAIKKKIDEFQDDEEDDDETGEKKNQAPIKAIGELGIEDLPPIEDLYITVPEKECNLLGKITSIVDQLVLVESLPNVVPLDLDTILFLDKGQRALGKVFDVMGQIHCPIYCVRFNTNQEIIDKGIQVGQDVYCAPSAPCTQIVILPELMKHKGSDASWKNDIEPPARFIEYSDDEEERMASRARRATREQTNGTEESHSQHIPSHHRNGHPGNHTYNRARRGGGSGGNSHHASFNYPRPNHHHMPMPNHMHHQPQYYYPPPGASANVYPNPFAQQQVDPRYYVNPFAYAPTVNYPPFNPNLFSGPPPPPPPQN